MKIKIAGEIRDVKMYLHFNGNTYGADTAVELINECATKDWGYKFAVDAAKKMAVDSKRKKATETEMYIAYKMDMYREATGTKLVLPDGDTETKAIIMFETLAKIHEWTYEREV